MPRSAVVRSGRLAACGALALAAIGGAFAGIGPIATGPVRDLNDSTLLFRQHYTLERIRTGQAPQTLVADGIATPTSAGSTLMPDYRALRGQATVALPGGGRTVAGQEAESF